MKSTLLKDFFREIKNDLSRFISLVLLIALAVAFFSGLRAAEPDMKLTADQYFDDYGLYDFRIASTLGITADDIDGISEIDNVEVVEGAFETDILSKLPDKDYVLRLHSLSEKFNCPELISGRLPQLSNEIAVSEASLTSMGKEIGQFIIADEVASGFENILKERSFKIVGSVKSPLYVSKISHGTSSLGAGTVGGYAYLIPEAFDSEVYTEAYLSVSGAKELNTYSDEYDLLTGKVRDALEKLADKREYLRYGEVIKEAKEELNKAKEKFAQKESEAYEKLSDAKSKLDDAEREINDGQLALSKAKEELASKKSQGEAKLREAKAQLDRAKIKLADGEKEYRKNKKKADSGRKQLLKAEEEFRKQKTIYDITLRLLNAGIKLVDRSIELLNTSAVDAGTVISELKAHKAELETLRNDVLSELKSLEEEGIITEEERERYEALIPDVDESIDLIEEALLDFEENGHIKNRITALLKRVRTHLEERRAELKKEGKKLDEAEKELNKQRKKLDSAEKQLAAAKLKLQKGKADYKSGLQSYKKNKEKFEREIAKAETLIAANAKKLQSAQEELRAGKERYLKAEKEAEDKLADGRKKISEAEKQIKKIEQCEWYVLGRDTNAGWVSFEQDAQRIGNLANVFPIIFFLVAALVCLTTMTRSVSEKRVEIGTLKALGCGRFAVSSKFIGYALLATTLGFVLGLFSGTRIIPSIVLNAYTILYTFTDAKLVIGADYTVISFLAAFICIVGTTVMTSMATLRESPANLMRPKAPKVGKKVLIERITPIWNRLSFFRKVTFRNIFRYKKRFIMTVVGIGACTALIITGLGLRDSVNAVTRKQFGEIYKCDMQVGLEKDMDDRDIAENPDLFKSDDIKEYSYFMNRSVTFSDKDGTADGYLVVAQNDNIKDYVTLRERVGKKELDLCDDGAIISEKLSELLKLKVGDEMTVESGGVRYTVKVSGITENYVYHYCYISRGYLKSVFGEEFSANQVMIFYANGSDEALPERLSQELIGSDKIASVNNISSMVEFFSKTMKSVNSAVNVVLVSAAMLAFIVLFTLSGINITERSRELATLKVLGFYDKETTRYVSRENIIFTALGVIFGILGGKYLLLWLIKTVEIDMAMFGRQANIESYVIAVAITFAFTFIVSFFERRRIRKIDMIESLKSVD